MTIEMLSARLNECGIPHDEVLPGKLLRYHELLLDWNTRMDLTAVTDEAEMMDKHYVDSLSALSVPGLIPPSGSLIDVGTGAGFPGLPLALACPDLQVTLMDAQQKRLTFLQAVIDELGVRNVKLVHARAEDGAQFPQHRERYDIAVARAVASLAVLSEYLLPYVKVGGKALCWKGPALMEELPQGRKAAFLLGGRVGEPVGVTFPGRDWQHLLLPIAKVAKTARQYPRKAGMPSKSPLGGNDKK
ncbi:MAG: 16S rRNA (guanine(527)-N(7))-methyltransferase RsmG [Clostridiales bacterium]|nr:16S rRNA (guanine(527)-N(7))-methyltransferase RsmG [Clostridiales bacterium]